MKLFKLLARIPDLIVGRLLSLRSHKTVSSVYYSQSNFTYGRYSYEHIANVAEYMHDKALLINVLADTSDHTVQVDVTPYLLLESLYQIMNCHYEGKFIETVYDKTHEDHWRLTPIKDGKIYMGKKFHQEFIEGMNHILHRTKPQDKAYLIAFMYRYYSHLLGTEQK